MMGSGEFYDRLEPLPTSSSSPSSGHASLPHNTPSIFSNFSSLYEEEAAFAPGSYPGSRNVELNSSSLDKHDLTSLDHRGMARQSNYSPSIIRSHPPHMSRDLSVGVVSSQHTISPSDIEYQLFSPTGSGSSRENTMPCQHFRNSSYDSYSSSHPSDSTSSASASHASASVGMADAPIRGSGRKDRNRPERGSGRSHASQMPGSSSGGSGMMGVASLSPELVMNGYATLPHVSSQAEPGETSATPISIEMTASLENLRLSDFESNMAFRRDNPGRISITKKSKSL